MKTTKVAIVGAGAGKWLTPFDDLSFEIWGLNSNWSVFRGMRFTRWFELHTKEYLQEEWGGHPDNEHFKWLRSLRDGMVVYLQNVRVDWPDILPAVEFPQSRLAKLVPAFSEYHACSIDWMIALAIAEGFKEIHLYGVEQQHTSEPISSRACIEFWAGVAIGRGLFVESHAGSTFKLAHLTFTRTPYAFDPDWRCFEDRTEQGFTRTEETAAMVKRTMASLAALK